MFFCHGRSQRVANYDQKMIYSIAVQLDKLLLKLRIILVYLKV